MKVLSDLWVKIPRCWRYHFVLTNEVVHYVWLFDHKIDVWSYKKGEK